ncbi:MAG: hypothetical protein JNM59_10195 [Hyphomonadaceae bacterium]|nr:hypothetical protein [Hyphomonadaceae bacterium]
MGITERIEAARHVHEFEAIAREIESSPQAAKYLALLRSRLQELQLNLPERLGAYGQRIMDSDEPYYEEIHKVFSLAGSLSTLATLGLDGARDWLIVIADDIRMNAAKDPRYNMVREDIFGDLLPPWWTH